MASQAELSALHKHPCPECGGDAEWNAAKQALTCPYCGTLVDSDIPALEGTDANAATVEILEYDLEHALSSGLGQAAAVVGGESRSVRCESCFAISSFDATRTAQRCDFCGSPAIVAHEPSQELIRPESLLPATVPETEVRDSLKKWYASRWFAPNKLKTSALTDTLHGIYLPYWTFDARSEADWTAESGYYYYVTESVRGADGKTSVRQVRKTRWEDSAGSLAHHFDDDLVPGTVGVHVSLLRKVEPFPTTDKLRPYDPAFVRGWTVERYQVDLQQSEHINRTQMDATLRNLCAAAVPGDTHRNLQVYTRHYDRTFKHILVPVWLISYTYGKKSFQVVANGYTGKIAGEYPLSWIKITFAVCAALVLLYFLYMSQAR